MSDLVGFGWVDYNQPNMFGWIRGEYGILFPRADVGIGVCGADRYAESVRHRFGADQAAPPCAADRADRTVLRRVVVAVLLFRHRQAHAGLRMAEAGHSGDRRLGGRPYRRGSAVSRQGWR